MDEREGKKCKKGFVLGLTGGVGGGKSTVLHLLHSLYGFHVIQADLVAKELMKPEKEGFFAVCRYLGKEILTPEGDINRLAMADLIFHDSQKRKGVDDLIHPLVWKAVVEEIRGQNGPVVIEAAIPSKEFRDKCDEMWYVYTSRENRMARLMADRGYSAQKAASIMDSQAKESEFLRFSDAVIDNNGTKEQIMAQIRLLLKEK